MSANKKLLLNSPTTTACTAHWPLVVLVGDYGVHRPVLQSAPGPCDRTGLISLGFYLVWVAGADDPHTLGVALVLDGEVGGGEGPRGALEV